MSGRAGAAGARGTDLGAFVANRVRRGFYLDSVVLMRISATIAARDGVETASLMIGSPSNLAILEDAGLLTDTGRGAGVNDLVVAVRATGEDALAAALEAAEASLAGADSGDSDPLAAGRSPGMRAACDALPGANLAIISVPGPFAAREARRALAAGLHVLVFSDNVPLEDEIALKREARDRGRMVMGPDCGTAIIAGVPLAFANRVRPGGIGVISASGTGLQELSVLVHRGGGGISHGIGVGGRDLGDAVGGIATFMALDALEADPDTRHLVVVSKPPGRRTESALLARIADGPKPVTLCLIGSDGAGGGLPSNATFAPTLRDAARIALGGDGVALGGGRAGGPGGGTHATADEGGPRAAGAERAPPAPRPGRIAGLYSGGTLCAEAQSILCRAGLAVASNEPIPGASRVEAGGGSFPASPVHTVIDLGADEYTTGRPHPMIEPAMRSRALAEALADPGVAAVVLDVVLGTGSHLDPSAAVAGVLNAAGPGRSAVFASVCGTELDPQDYEAQRRALERAGVFVAESNADAVEAAVHVVESGAGHGR